MYFFEEPPVLTMKTERTENKRSLSLEYRLLAVIHIWPDSQCLFVSALVIQEMWCIAWDKLFSQREDNEFKSASCAANVSMYLDSFLMCFAGWEWGIVTAIILRLDRLGFCLFLKDCPTLHHCYALSIGDCCNPTWQLMGPQQQRGVV